MRKEFAMKFDFLIRNLRSKMKVVSFYIFFKIPNSLRSLVNEDKKLANSLAYAFRYTEEHTWKLYPVKVFVGKKDPKKFQFGSAHSQALYSISPGKYKAPSASFPG